MRGHGASSGPNCDNSGPGRVRVSTLLPALNRIGLRLP
jgi:hypothetical protein